MRNERGIPPFEPQPPDDFVRDLGTMSDSDFARKHGVTVRSATYHRTKRGIESHRSKMSALRGVDSNPQR